MDAEHLEYLRVTLNLGVALITIALSGLVGQWLTCRWNLRQKQRESDLAAAESFHKLYGEFFTIWKLWDCSLKAKQVCTISHSDLLQRACAAEGNVESLFVRLAAGRKLRDEDICTLGCFRQGYQSLREAIRENQKLDWDNDKHSEYIAFKRLATEVALLIVSEKLHKDVTTKTPADALENITSNEWEEIWYKHIT